ncbi:MAG: rRNA pseudouridine synthase [Clostridia bacterium]|nr:rRNA pseudouridine synthase [Clostridia bacterium]
MRIDKFISERGIATRRECSLAARRGGVLVDGVPVRDASVHIDPERQSVTYLGRVVDYRKFTYIMMNKPDGYVSATEDARLPVITELLPDEERRMELFPVGRLDRDTVGLVMLTNDGQLAHRLLSPKRHVSKTYRFKCAEELCFGAEELFRSGITLADGYECKSAELEADADRLGGYITLTEGKYHQIKRMLGAISNRVTFLERVSFGGIELDGSLGRGEWRYLTDSEVAHLSSLVN